MSALLGVATRSARVYAGGLILVACSGVRSCVRIEGGTAHKGQLRAAQFPKAYRLRTSTQILNTGTRDATQLRTWWANKGQRADEKVVRLAVQTASHQTSRRVAGSRVL